MTPDPNDPDKAPTPEELLAWADGELPPDGADAAEAWMRRHPDAAADVEALRRMTGLCQGHAAPEPAPAAWDATLQRVASRLAGPKPRPGWTGGSLTLRIGVGLAAACVVGLLVVNSFRQTPPPSTPVPLEEDEPYAVATADEIVIVSMDPRNTGNLVVGGPPIPGDLDLAEFDDVRLLDRKPNDDGQVPQMHQGGNVPIILPTGSWGGKED